MNTTQQISFAAVHFFIGIDAHLKNWKVTIRLDGLELKTFSSGVDRLSPQSLSRRHLSYRLLSQRLISLRLNFLIKNTKF